jgi:L-serine dehydratase
MSLSVFQIFKIGIGPSSSHTVGPMKAAKLFLQNAKSQGLMRSKNIRQVKAELFGSLALTGKGHATDKALVMGLIGEDPENVDTATIYQKVDQLQKSKMLKLLGEEKETDFIIQFHKNGKLPYHTNGMRFTLIDDNNEEIFKEIYYSIGGGFILNENETLQNDGDKPTSKPNSNCNSTWKNSIQEKKVPYPFKTTEELITLCKENNLSISELLMENEKTWRTENEIKIKLDRLWEVMDNCIKRGLKAHGVLPGPLQVERRSPKLYDKLRKLNENPKDNNIIDPFVHLNWINCWALAVSEENSIGGQVVTAPTNGSAGVIPAVIMYYLKYCSEKHPNKIHDFLLTSAAVGMIIKLNATVSGAEGGCQAEIGASSSMAAAGLTAALGGGLSHIENAAEIALEHFIGLTCDPVGGVVQIPCIERNAVAAVKSVNAAALALETSTHKVSLDNIIKVMKQTGDDMKTKYKETSKGGIAKVMEEDIKAGIKLMKQKEQEKDAGITDYFMNNTLC